MSVIQAISAAYYTTMANNSAFAMMSANNARLSMLGNISNNLCFGSLESLHAKDTQLELDMITNSLQYKMAKAMLEQIKKQQKEDAEKFNVFA